MIKLFNNDCMAIIDEMISNSNIIDHVVCDLPYYQVVKNEFDNQWRSLDEYIKWINVLLNKIKCIIKPGGNVILFCSRQNMWRICQSLYNNGFEENRTIIWTRKKRL